MLKYQIITCIFGWFALYALWAVLRLGFGAIVAESPAERRFCLGFGIWWFGAMVFCAAVTAAAVCRITALNRRSKAKQFDDSKA
jgi:hypothetical protein